jgi:hypothetical protein
MGTRTGGEVEAARLQFRLEPGSHRSPDDGVCIVEFVSMLAGEPFSDRPRCVCDVIGAFLRAWNDRAGYVDRQRLIPYASRVIGTSGNRAATRARRDLCLDWVAAELGGGRRPRWLGRQLMRGRIGWLLGLKRALRLNQGAGEYAARLCFARNGSDAAFDLLDRMLEIGAGEKPQARGANGNGHRSEELAVRAAIIARERAGGRPQRPSSNGNGNGGVPRRRRTLV